MLGALTRLVQPVHCIVVQPDVQAVLPLKQSDAVLKHPLIKTVTCSNTHQSTRNEACGEEPPTCELDELARIS